MLTLVLDSSTKRMYMALVLKDTLLTEAYYEGLNNHSEYIVSGIKKMLDEHNKNIKELNKIVVGIGPGSYTGVRLAVTTAKMLSVLLNIDLYQISSLALMSSSTKGKTLASIDARHGNVFGGIYEDGKVLFEDFLLYEDLLKHEHLNEVNVSSFKVDPLVCIKASTLVLNKELLVPNYLRDTEAERNLCQK